jgi:hypothetical protein
MKSIIKFQKKYLFNNTLTGKSMLADPRHNNLRVISTPEFPVPYYQRIYRAPAAVEETTIDLTHLNRGIDDELIIQTKSQLSKTSEGLKSLEFIENKVSLKSYITSVDSVGVQANIYAEDLMNYIDCAFDENKRILDEVDLSDCLKI